MLTALLTSTLLLASPISQRGVARIDLDLKPVVLTPQIRLEAARRSFAGREKVDSVGATRTRTFLEKGTPDLRIGANSPKGYADGVARLGTGSSFFAIFRAKPGKLYAVTIAGRFDCTAYKWQQNSENPNVPGSATVPIAPGESTAVIGLKAFDKEVALFVAQPTGGKSEFLVQRVEVTELN